jgi:hypothetical protein
MSMRAVEIVVWREPTWATTDLVGFEVEATDGKVGKVDEKTKDVQNQGFVVVDTGPWILGKKVMLPAGVVERVDDDEEKVWVDRTKDQIKNAPEFDEDRYRDDTYRSEVGSYYDRGGAGYVERR